MTERRPDESPMDDLDDLDALLLEHREGTLDEEGRTRVTELLRSSAAARSRYVELQSLTLALELHDPAVPADVATPSSLENVVPAKPSTPSAGSRRRSWPVVLIAVALVAVAGRWLFLESSRHSQTGGGDPARNDGIADIEPDEATANGVALITRLVDVEWDPQGPSHEVGDAVVPGRISLASGFAQVEFFCGATVVVEGPAELEIESPTAARFLSGRLRAKVPPAARGFEVHVGEMTVVDLGTEFGLAVSPEGADVQVFDGEVELRRPNADVERVLGGQAVRQEGAELAETELDPERFVDIASLEERERARTQAGFGRWKTYSTELRADPRLIGYYAFDSLEPWERTLAGSTVPANDELDGAIVGANHVPGRWETKGALEFKRPGDRVKVRIPGEHGSLTLACWVRIDSLDRSYNSLFLTDHYERGEPHWQILDSGRLFFSIRHNEPGEQGRWHHAVISEPFWKPAMSGEWLHLATSFDSESGRVTHYLDGQPLHEEVIPAELRPRTTRIGTASIGNWAAPTKPDAEFAIRNLNGRIDEFAIFGAALEHDDIREMYEHGKP